MTYLMQIETGAIATIEEWEQTFSELDEDDECYGMGVADCALLIEVISDAEGHWREKEQDEEENENEAN